MEAIAAVDYLSEILLYYIPVDLEPERAVGFASVDKTEILRYGVVEYKPAERRVNDTL